MAKKSNDKKRAPRVRGERLWEAFSSKIEAHAMGKKVAEKTNKQHTPLVARVLLSFDKPVGLERIVTAAKNAGYDCKNVEHYVKGDLAILVREGLAKVMIEAKTNTTKRARAPRKQKPAVLVVEAREAATA